MKKLILKYLTNSISDKELTKLRDWLNNPKNEETFKAYVKDNYNLNGIYENVDVEAAFIKVWNKAQKQTKVIPLYKHNLFKYAVAASVVLLVSLTFMFNKGNTEGDINAPVIVNNNIETGTDKAILTLEDGTNVTLEKGQDYVADNIISNGEEIIYNDITSPKAEIAYNSLTIPRGGQYYIKLADGTEVWLNSESQLKYPVSFADGQTRSVELVYGEAYFDVSSSENHNGDRFKVLNQGQEVEVLGTEFNIKAYKDENYIYTTLVEGKVTVESNQHRNFLEPDQQSILNTSTKEVKIIQANTYSEIAWKKGLFSFKNKNLKDISKVLSRWYDVDFIFENESLEQIEFKGVLSRNQNIEEILILIKNTNFINAYDIKNTTITIKN